MGKVSESIWSNGLFTIPMAEVAFIESILDDWSKKNKQIRIIFKYSKWDNDDQCFQPSVCLTNEMTESFKKDWCNYRAELESETLMNPYPIEIAAENLKGFFDDIQNICKEYKPHTGA